MKPEIEFGLQSGHHRALHRDPVHAFKCGRDHPDRIMRLPFRPRAGMPGMFVAVINDLERAWRESFC